MDRRNFLKAGVAGFAGSFVFGSAITSLPRQARAANVEINLSTEELIKSVTAAKNVLTWQFVNPLQAGPGNLFSGIVVYEGDLITVNLQNNLSTHSVNFVAPGLLDASPEVAPGTMRTYEFVAANVGTYLFTDNFNGELGKAMGLTGPLVVLPADGTQSLTPNNVTPNTFDREYTLVMHEIDSRINDAIEANLPVDMATYEPDYFFVNGLSFPDSVYTIVDGVETVDDSKVVYMLANENVAIRFINAGLIYYPMHFHGYHVDVITRNRQLEESVVEKDTVLLGVGECVESILSVGTQLGLYPLHTHYVPGVTSNGVYAGGGLIMMKAV